MRRRNKKNRSINLLIIFVLKVAFIAERRNRKVNTRYCLKSGVEDFYARPFRVL